ncbi:hypothetical protein OJF2_51930 [Aquisphaera giovannonii]|uniref:Uncharacterized protein n=1 Tax=Aquisphaera giovannonii TaxID=406548 RepID=A0A5B9W8V4_9BACT|nr:hypothetical protein [Aquisphaera giovannonii]QEH36609.1 hypothetical protein OJF2_51930 [Aquisphaera giovannonii]
MDDYYTDPEEISQQQVTIPIVTDGIPRSGPGPRLARCVYFSITADEPNRPWFLGLPNVTIPFLMLGLQGIIFRSPLRQSGLFVTPDDWNELVTIIEQQDGFSVEFEYFWVPVSLLDRARGQYPPGDESPNGLAVRGEVFRLGHKLFLEAWRAARDGTDFVNYANRVLDYFDGDRLAAGLTYSPEETRSIQAWAIAQVAGSIIG